MKIFADCRNKLEAGEYTLIQYLFKIAKSVQPATNGLSEQSDDDSLYDLDEDEILVGKCCVCLLRKDTTIVFLPADMQNVAKNVAYIWKNAQYADLRLNKCSVYLHRNLLFHLSIFSYISFICYYLNSTNWVQNWCSLNRKFILIRTNSNIFDQF